MTCKRGNPLKLKKLIFLAWLLHLGLPTVVRAQQDQEFDEYKLRIDGFWFYSNPSGNFQGAADNGAVDLQGDLHFSTHSTFSGKIDWKFTRKTISTWRAVRSVSLHYPRGGPCWPRFPFWVPNSGCT